MKTGYITDSFSTLGGLAAVAYGDSEYFREVQNQIYAQSPTKFLNLQQPSDIFESFFGTKEFFAEIVLKALVSQYATEQKFADFVDVKFGPTWKTTLLAEFKSNFFDQLNSTEEYGLTLLNYVGRVVERTLPGFTQSEELANKISSTIQNEPRVGADANLIAKAVSNNPQVKVSVPPTNSRVNLNTSVDLGSDYRGVKISQGYISPQNYWNDIAFPGLTNSVVPTGLKDAVKSGYVGYLSTTPLEALYNQSGGSSVLNTPDRDGAPISSILSQFPDSLPGDRDIYSISLLGEKLNGYTTFDPGTMSNGDLLDRSLTPAFEEDNSDPQGGLNSTARNFTPAF